MLTVGFRHARPAPAYYYYRAPIPLRGDAQAKPELSLWEVAAMVGAIVGGAVLTGIAVLWITDL